MKEIFKKEHVPYLDKDKEKIDFNEKRLKFWLENVPADIRRWEYDFWKLHRQYFHRNFHADEKTKYVGRFQVTEFTQKDDERYWDEFKESFLVGPERKKQFVEIIGKAESDLPELINLHSDKVNKNRIKLIALAGSSFYGPRLMENESELFEEKSDIDINFLFDTNKTDFNFEVLPFENKKMGIYHLRGTGWSDNSRGGRDEIHWLLYPHFPLYNTLSSEELKSLSDRLIQDTYSRKNEIFKQMRNLKTELKEGESIITG